MRRPRTSFATSFVVVVGCSGPAVVPPPPPPLRPEPLPIVDAQPTPQDAALPDAAPREACVEGEVDARGNPIDFIDSHTAVGRVVEVERLAKKLRVTVEIPRSDQIDAYWRAQFVDASGRPIEREHPIADLRRGQLVMVVDEMCQLPSLRVQLTRPQCCVNPPGPSREARIVGISIEGGATVVTFGAGSKDGVTAQSHAEVAAPHGECTIVSVAERTTKCRVTLTPDELKQRAQTVRVTR